MLSVRLKGETPSNVRTGLRFGSGRKKCTRSFRAVFKYRSQATAIGLPVVLQLCLPNSQGFFSLDECDADPVPGKSRELSSSLPQDLVGREVG